MVDSTLENQVLALLSIHQPIKARKLAKMLADEFGKHVDRSDTNSILYRLKSENITSIDNKYEWTMKSEETNAQKGSRTKEQVSETTAITQPAITFTAEQQAIIDLDPSNHLLIRGQAGSGKTTILAARAGKIISATSKGSLLFLTYNTALTAYVKRSFEKSGMKGDIEIKTFHEWARETAEQLGATFNGWIDSKRRDEQLSRIISSSRGELGPHRLLDMQGAPELREWWSCEIAWLFGQHITKLGQYLSTDRVGRGTATRISQDDRKIVWSVFEAYQEWLEESRLEDYDNPAGLILRTIEETATEFPDNLRYDHLCIDEVQDFDKSWLMAAVKVPRVSLTMAGDLAQKIYHRNFTWSSVGIKVQGARSKNLMGSHRTTKEIMMVAKHLLVNNDVSKHSEYLDPEMPKRHGDKVRIIVTHDPKTAYQIGYEWVADRFRSLRTSSVAVILPFSRQLKPAKISLENLGLKVRTAKGTTLGNFSGGVVVTTYHQIKGLEFDHVVIMGLHDAQYPGRLLTNIPQEDRDEELQLMRRVLYVAMTRAKQSVTLVGSLPFCRFFDEVPDDLFKEVETAEIAD